MKFKEYRASKEFNADRDGYCVHCLIPFSDEDELGRCEQTNHVTHPECTKHSP